MVPRPLAHRTKLLISFSPIRSYGAAMGCIDKYRRGIDGAPQRLSYDQLYQQVRAYLGTIMGQPPGSAPAGTPQRLLPPSVTTKLPFRAARWRDAPTATQSLSNVP